MGTTPCFLFHATKVFHTIEGGGASFSNPALRDRLLRLRNFGLNGEDADLVGANAKMSEFHAAMGLCNLRHVDEEIQKRKAASDRYDARLKDVKGLQLFPQIEELKRNYAYYPVVVRDAFGKTRDEIVVLLRERGIMARKYFYPLTNSFSCFHSRFSSGNTPIAEDIASRVLCLPLYADLTVDEINAVCDALEGE